MSDCDFEGSGNGDRFVKGQILPDRMTGLKPHRSPPGDFHGPPQSSVFAPLPTGVTQGLSPESNANALANPMPFIPLTMRSYGPGFVLVDVFRAP